MKFEWFWIILIGGVACCIMMPSLMMLCPRVGLLCLYPRKKMYCLLNHANNIRNCNQFWDVWDLLNQFESNHFFLGTLPCHSWNMVFQSQFDQDPGAVKSSLGSQDQVMSLRAVGVGAAMLSNSDSREVHRGWEIPCRWMFIAGNVIY